MTSDQLEHRDYSYCSASYREATDDPAFVYGYRTRWERFLVGSPFLAEACERAEAFAESRWGKPEDINIYPRNYIREARELFAAGRHD